MRMFIILFVFFHIYFSFAQSNKYFIKNYGERYRTEEGNKILFFPPVNFFIAGNAAPTPDNPKWVSYVLKIHIGGDTVWTKTYGNITDHHGFFSIDFADSSHFILGGVEFTYPGYGYYSLFIVKIDTNGTAFFSNTISDSLLDRGYGFIRKTHNNRFIVTGSRDSAIKRDPFIIMLDADGNFLWEKVYYGTTYSMFYWFEKLPDSCYIFTGNYNLTFSNVGDIWLVKTDTAGNILWDMKYDGTLLFYPPFTFNSNQGRCVQPTPDNGYIIGGNLYDNWFTYDGVVIKADSIGNLIWFKQINPVCSSEFGAVTSVRALPDNSYVVTGDVGQEFYLDSNPQPYGNTNVLLMKLNSSGDVLWWRSIDPNGDTCLKNGLPIAMADEGYDVIVTNDGGFAITGRTASCTPEVWYDTILPDTIYADAFLIKTNCLGFVGPPDASFFNIADFFAGNSFIFYNTSLNTDTCWWDFGDGSPMVMQRADTLWTDTPSVIHGFSTGTYTVTLVAYACGETDTFFQTVTIINIEKNTFSPGIKIYPNPAGNKIFVEHNISGDKNPFLSLLNIFGQEILLNPLQCSGQIEEIDVSAIHAGNYFYTVYAAGEVHIRGKFMIMR